MGLLGNLAILRKPPNNPQYPKDPCMVYLPTFFHRNKPNVPTFTIEINQM